MTVDRTVGVNMEQYFNSIFDFGFFANTGFSAHNNILLDSYNSNKGSYGGDNMLGHQAILAPMVPQMRVLRSNKEAHPANCTGTLPQAPGTDPDPENLLNVISLPSEDVLKDGMSRMVLNSEFWLPSVDLYNLPPRDMFSTSIDFKSWFSSQPSVSGPLESSLINTGHNKGL